ncbi:MAG: hypothetical protein KC621_08690 [Myxococcales bacterium]|nr:hypothetical protein [Myxococcales bacterium]
MYIERSSDGFRAVFAEAPSWVYASLLSLLSDEQRRAVSQPLPAAAQMFIGGGMLLGAAIMILNWDTPGAWASGKHGGGAATFGACMFGLTGLMAFERMMWGRFGSAELVLTVKGGTVAVYKRGRLQVEAPLDRSELRHEQHLLGLVVDGRLHHWETGCSVRDLRQLTEHFTARRQAFGSPEDVPLELRGVVRATAPVAER